jgi:hypothetical protein
MIFQPILIQYHLKSKAAFCEHLFSERMILHDVRLP